MAIKKDGTLAGQAADRKLIADARRETKETTKKGTYVDIIAQNAAVDDKVDVRFYSVLIFQSGAMRDEFLAKAGLSGLGDQFIDGMAVAKRLKITLTTPVPPVRAFRGKSRLAELAQPLPEKRK